MDDLSVCLSVQCIVAKRRSGSDAVWHHRSDGSRDEAGSWGLGIGPLEGVVFGATGCAIVTNGDFTAYVCDSAATRFSSQITWGKLVVVAAAVYPRSELSISDNRSSHQ